MLMLWFDWLIVKLKIFFLFPSLGLISVILLMSPELYFLTLASSFVSSSLLQQQKIKMCCIV